MKDFDRIMSYNTRFNQHAALVTWDDTSLRFHYRKGLAPRLKEELAHMVEQRGLIAFKRQMTELDNKYWIRVAEKKREQGMTTSDSKGKPKNSNTSTNPQKSTTSSDKPSNSSSNQSTQPSISKSGSSNKSNKKPYADKLGNDGKLLRAKMKRCKDAGLCVYCGGKHKLEDCFKRKKNVEAKARFAESTVKEELVSELAPTPQEK
jgi:DNA mismatch repair ATPase MutL